MYTTYSSNSITIDDILAGGIKTQEIRSDKEITFKIDNEEVSFTIKELKRLKEIIQKKYPEDYI